MKRYGNLWNDVVSFEALLRAGGQARQGKRFRPAVAASDFHLEHELLKLEDELSTLTYRPGWERSFFIYEPKKRQISAAPYRDRVVHHALVSVLEPIFERTFIGDSYACRKGEGTHVGHITGDIGRHWICWTDARFKAHGADRWHRHGLSARTRNTACGSAHVSSTLCLPTANPTPSCTSLKPQYSFVPKPPH